jgi:hypothetical protein
MRHATLNLGGMGWGAAVSASGLECNVTLHRWLWDSTTEENETIALRLHCRNAVNAIYGKENCMCGGGSGTRRRLAVKPQIDRLTERTSTP